MQRTVGAGRIPVDLENGHDSLTRVFPFTEGFRVRVIAKPHWSTREISMALLPSPPLSSPLPYCLPPLRPNNRAIYAVIVSIPRFHSRALLRFFPRIIFKRIIFTVELTTCTVVTLVGRMRPTFVISLQEQQSDQDRSIVPLRPRYNWTRTAQLECERIRVRETTRSILDNKDNFAFRNWKISVTFAEKLCIDCASVSNSTVESCYHIVNKGNYTRYLLDLHIKIGFTNFPTFHKSFYRVYRVRKNGFIQFFSKISLNKIWIAK